MTSQDAFGSIHDSSGLYLAWRDLLLCIALPLPSHQEEVLGETLQFVVSWSLVGILVYCYPWVAEILLCSLPDYLTFTSLRASPVDIYQATAWTSSIPHFTEVYVSCKHHVLRGSHLASCGTSDRRYLHGAYPSRETMFKPWFGYFLVTLHLHSYILGLPAPAPERRLSVYTRYMDGSEVKSS